MPSQKLFVEKVGLVSPQLNQIKRLAAFQNSEFYKKQRLSLSTNLTPRVITCAEELADEAPHALARTLPVLECSPF